MINREDLLSGTRPEVGSRILMTVENNFQGYEIVDYKGMVWGISMRSKDMGQDFLMGCKQFTGGELSSYTELADEGRQRAIDRMLSMARRLKANAIINFNLSNYSIEKIKEEINKQIKKDIIDTLTISYNKNIDIYHLNDYAYRKNKDIKYNLDNININIDTNIINSSYYTY